MGNRSECRTINATAIIGAPFEAEYPLYPTSVCFCVYGWMFPVLAGVSFAFFIVSAIGWKITPAPRWHRRLVYLFFAAAYLLRGVYTLVLAVRVGSLRDKPFVEALPVSDTFIDSGIPANALADLWAAFVDAVLAMFWLRSHMVIDERRWLAIMIGAGHVIMATCIGVDAQQLQENKSDAVTSPEAGLALWRSTLWCIGAIMTVSSAAHIASVCVLVRATVKYHLWESDEVRREVVKGIVIAMVTALCSVTRGVALVLRQASAADLFVSGELSFDNPSFTAGYYLVLLNVPTIVTSLVFADVYAERLRTAFNVSAGPVLVPTSPNNSSRQQPDFYDYD